MRSCSFVQLAFVAACIATTVTAVARPFALGSDVANICNHPCGSDANCVTCPGTTCKVLILVCTHDSVVPKLRRVGLRTRPSHDDAGASV
ncbi:hypothetical protein C8Q77DRAFT_1129945 [Trametes polyzona]|nr:hypothetical protein C8Q77DRAFT_1129945 [Trametes polyzona]